MKIKELYLEDFINLIKAHNIDIQYDDNKGKYIIEELGINICVWNNKIEINKDFALRGRASTEEKIIKLMSIVRKTNEFWWEE